MEVKCRGFLTISFFIIALSFCNTASGLDATNLNKDREALRNVLDFVLKTHGTSFDAIGNKIAEGSGNLDKIIGSVNTEITQNVLKIDGDSIKVDYVPLRVLIRNAVRNYSRTSFSDNPLLAFVIQKNVNDQLNAHENEIKKALDQNVIPAEGLRNLATLLSFAPHRQRRDAAGSNPLDIGQVISNVILGTVEAALKGVVLGVLDNVKNLLLNFYTATPPAGSVDQFFASISNFVVLEAVQFITVIQTNINGGSAPVALQAQIKTLNNETDTVNFINKRDVAGDGTDVAADAGTGTGISGLIGGILDFIRNILAVLLGPLNGIITGTVNSLLENIYPSVGYLVLTPVRELIFWIINLLLPCNNCS